MGPANEACRKKPIRVGLLDKKGGDPDRRGVGNGLKVS